MAEYKKCFVPACKNDSKNSSKTIVRIREDLRKKWCKQVNVTYFQCYAQYCCEDHFDPKQDLTNIYFKIENIEPRFKPTAKLRNIGVNLKEEVSSGRLQSDECQSELAIMLSLSEPELKKKKYEGTNNPSTSGSCPQFKIQVAVQATVNMSDKSTNTRFKTGKLISLAPDEAHSFSTSESEERETLKSKLDFRKRNLKKILKKPKTYLGLPKQYSWLIDHIVENTLVKIDPLCIVATLIKIKQNDTIDRISDALEISHTKLSTMILNGIEALGSFFQNFILSPQPMTIKTNLPAVFKIRYSNVQIIIDCLEIQICKPSNTLRQSQTWSHCKGCHTVKYLIGCTPDGLISFISKGVGGRVSDKALVEGSNLLDTLQPNAVVLADRGFKEIEGLLNARGMKLLRPPSVFSGVIANLRIHAERAIRRLRGFSILKPHSEVHHKYVPYLDQIVIIACGLTNLQDNKE